MLQAHYKDLHAVRPKCEKLEDHMTLGVSFSRIMHRQKFRRVKENKYCLTTNKAVVRNAAQSVKSLVKTNVGTRRLAKDTSNEDSMT